MFFEAGGAICCARGIASADVPCYYVIDCVVQWTLREGASVATKTSTYTGEDISQLKGLEAVRRLPGMYIGDNAAYGLHHILLEVVDNAVDEAMAGVCDRIVVTILADGSVSVEDNGRGIPVDLKEDKGKSALTLALTELHTGAISRAPAGCTALASRRPMGIPSGSRCGSNGTEWCTISASSMGASPSLSSRCGTLVPICAWVCLANGG